MAIFGAVGIHPDGQQADNASSDQLVIINLLDAIDPAQGGTRPADGSEPMAWSAPEDGVCADDLHAAIVTFQETQGIGTFADGVVDPNGQTIARLEQLAGEGQVSNPEPEQPEPEQPEPEQPEPEQPETSDIPTLSLWLNAFIPRDIPDLTHEVPDGSGNTMIPGPFVGVSDCFLTDQRDFSSAPEASSRLHCAATVDLASGLLISQEHRCDASVEVDCEDGDEEGRAHGDTSRMSFSGVRGSVSTQWHLDLRAAANNPLFTGSPDIDAIGTFSIDVGARRVQFAGKVDEFPAFEAYARASDGETVTLLQLLPLPGNSPGNLFGGADRAVDVQASF